MNATKACNECGITKPEADFYLDRGKPRSNCKDCHKAAVLRRQAANREQHKERCRQYYRKNRESMKSQSRKYYYDNTEAILARKAANRSPKQLKLSGCAGCGELFQPWRRDQVACSKPCFRQYYQTTEDFKQRNRAWSRKMKALRSGVRSVDYDAAEVFARDDWTCQLCFEPIDSSKEWPHPYSQSIDHIIPIALGGDDVPENVQAAHLRCNQSKGHRVELSG